MPNELLYPGQFELDGVLVIGSSGVRKEISALITEINIYQSLDSPYMSGHLMINDSDEVSSTLPFIGNERLLFKVNTPGGTPIDFNHYHAVTYNVKKRTHSSDRSQVVLLDFTSLDNFRNTYKKVSKAFKGEISSMVETILRNPKHLGSSKPINIEKTLGIRKFVMPNVPPYVAINILKEEAISAEEKSAHYVFYENQLGYHFRSLDSLLGKRKEQVVTAKATYIYQHPSSATAGESARQNPAGALETILDWEIHDNTNSFLNMKNGMYSSTLFTHDIFNKNIQKYEYNYSKTHANRNTSYINGGPVVPDIKLNDDAPLTEQHNSRTFLHPTGKSLFVKPDPEDSKKTIGEAIHNNSKSWLQESTARYVERVSHFTLKIETYGNTDLMVGDMINVIIPSNKPLYESGSGSIDHFLSGRYMITNINHLIVPSKKSHRMFMYVMKDSLYDSLILEETEYVEPSTGVTFDATGYLEYTDSISRYRTE
mgnify:CR=1 FL=1